MTYDLGELLTIAALASLATYLLGRAHAERAAERARERRRAYRHTLNNNNQRKETH